MDVAVEDEIVTIESRRVYRAIEREVTDIPLTEMIVNKGQLDLYEDVQAKQYFTFTLKKDKIVLLAGNHIGLIPLNSKVALLVEPKIARQNWLHIVGKAEAYIRDINYLRHYSRSDTTSRSIVEFLSRTLVKQLEPIILQGILRQYKPEKYITSFPRGRILIGKSIKHVWPYRHHQAVEVEQYCLTKDNAYNQLLKYALHLSVGNLSTLLGNSSQKTPDIEKELRRLFPIINELEDLLLKIPLNPNTENYIPEVMTSLERDSIPDTRYYYRDACKTALLIVESSGLIPTIEDKKKEEIMPSFVINMEDIFEDYCRNLLHDSAQRNNWLSVIHGKKDKKKLFTGDNADQREAEPDVVIELTNGEKYPIEIKYKSDPNRENINQAITYALAYNKSKAFLVCFTDKDQGSGWNYMGNVGNQIDLWVYHINLESLNIEQEEVNYTTEIDNKIRQI